MQKVVFAADARRFEPGATSWRTFDVTTRVEMALPEGGAQVWVPVPSIESDWQQSLSTSFGSNGEAALAHDASQGVKMVHARFQPGTATALLEVTSRVRTRDRAVDWQARGAARPDASLAAAWTQPTPLIPTDGLVRAAALQATEGVQGDVPRLRAIYDWVATNVHREPSVRGCGEGDVNAMLKMSHPSGKCADINALFVGMCRSVGIPARDLYGVRIAPSAFGYKELGGNSEKLAAAQHCRAEAFVRGQGWVAMDPADVTKVMRQETAQWIRNVDHPVVKPVYDKLFGCCEGNWMAYNDAHDVVLPGSSGRPMGFLMYPVAETSRGRLDSYAPDTFGYRISAREVA
ncbi:MAG: transglutaminase family protein [Gammaproteobacteria bacterium]|nr:transglutaminase family protein [Gammaproteobacteria bacterium]MBU1440209.1 transglutaminase family protein [Gammaproteobacteria bacterium]MBU2288335.1 transglutaminase family protein [Gammaproteobacteria bacterium]MBU2409968.1 transglutaminase family protein [Gammaproteobacteria bacterium]